MVLLCLPFRGEIKVWAGRRWAGSVITGRRSNGRVLAGNDSQNLVSSDSDAWRCRLVPLSLVLGDSSVLLEI